MAHTQYLHEQVVLLADRQSKNIPITLKTRQNSINGGMTLLEQFPGRFNDKVISEMRDGVAGIVWRH
jgi:hypothetical protein